MVVEFRQLESTDKDCQTEDMRVFMVYDEDEDLMYVYGSRKSESHRNQVEFVKTFDTDDQLYDFLNVIMGFDEKHRVNTSVHYMDGLSDYSGFDDFVRNASRTNEISGYNREKMTKKRFKQYISVLC
jgi:regulation of enolase protein 1 (concanavalin A-like superfamily)